MNKVNDILTVIPARGSSKRVPLKNIKELNGKPLLAYTIEAALEASLNDIVVSTDSEKIACLSKTYGVRVVIRPDEFATDKASTESVLLHALDIMEGVGNKYKWVMTLQPTSPFRSAKTIKHFINILYKKSIKQDCLMSVTENRGDFWQMCDEGLVKRLFPDAPRRQQDRIPLFEENSAIYITLVEALRRTNSVLGNSVRGIAIDPFEAFDINTDLDFQIAEALLKNRRCLI